MIVFHYPLRKFFVRLSARSISNSQEMIYLEETIFFSLLLVVSQKSLFPPLPQAPLPQKTESKMEEPVSGQENPTKYKQLKKLNKILTVDISILYLQ